MIRSFVFSQTQGKLISQDISLDLLNVVLRDEGVQFWVDVGEVSDDEAKQILDGIFHFHPLAVEDCLAPTDRSKVDEYDNYVFMVIHAVDYSKETGSFATHELNVFIGKEYLVTFHREPLRCVNATIDRIMKNAPTVARAPDRLSYTLLDFLLEGYDPALEELSSDIAELEGKVLDHPSSDILGAVRRLKKEVQKLHQIVRPQRDVIARFAHGEFKIVRAHMLPYYRDLNDQLVRISSLAENYRDSITNVLQMHLNFQQMQVNKVIKVLTVLATLSVPILAVTSYYGMNIQHWPTLNHSMTFSYTWIWGITVVMTAFLYWLLKRKGWW
ncbi:MAG: magnesium transporter CorA family protein [Kiritimatiellae bacterium]|nr:magnesium transporter CorA family protein [Kiritimatiellia bacterium]MDD5522155.1 magnesium transporter CorA family protein [Kiritimatiellia bacterium]